MKTYELTLKHDSGTVNIQTRAESIQQAQAMIFESEKAPESAIVTWRVVPTKRQIQKTKSLLRAI